MNETNLSIIILTVAGILLLAGGIVLLVLSIRSTIRKKKRIGGIVGGGIMIFSALMAWVLAVVFLLANVIATETTNDRTVQLMARNIQKAVGDKDADYLSGLFAREGYSGDDLESEDAEELFSYIDGDIEDVTYIVNGVSKNRSIRCVSYKYTIETTEGKYTLNVDYMTMSPNPDHGGIQHLQLKGRGGKLCEFGEEPEL